MRGLSASPSNQEKSSVYEEPYYDISIDLFGRGDAYQILKTKRLVHFMTTSYIRGITLRDAVILIDECQNMSFHELDSIITRVGENCRVIFCGDFSQSDLKQNGMREFFEILNSMNRKKKITDRNKILEEEMKKNLLRRKNQTKSKVKLIRKEKKWP